jgi:hypothetical protein
VGVLTRTYKKAAFSSLVCLQPSPAGCGQRGGGVGGGGPSTAHDRGRKNLDLEGPESRRQLVGYPVGRGVPRAQDRAPYLEPWGRGPLKFPSR